MAVIAETGIKTTQNLEDGLHVEHVAIQNSSSTGTIISNDNWNSITFHAVQVVNAGSTSTQGPNVITGLPSHHWFDDLATDGTNNSLGFVTNSGTGSTKTVHLHKSGSDWRLRHTSHGHNYTYLVIFSLAST